MMDIWGIKASSPGEVSRRFTWTRSDNLHGIIPEEDNPYSFNLDRRDKEQMDRGDIVLLYAGHH